MMLPQNLTAHSLRSAVSPTTYQKAAQYYRNGHVQDIAIFTSGDQETNIHATVLGTHPYQVKIHIYQTSNLQTNLETACSCPVGRTCKHVIATLLEVINSQSGVKTQDTTSTQDPTSISPPTPAVDPQLKHWLATLRNFTQPTDTKPDVDTTYCLLYIFSPTQRINTIQVELSLCRRLKAGGFGAPKRFHLESESTRKHLTLTDQALITKLRAAEVWSPYYTPYAYYHHERFELHGPIGEEVLTELLATKQCYWQSRHTQPLTLGPSYDAALQWMMDEDGAQTLQCIANDKQVKLFAIHNTWYYDAEQSTLGRLTTQFNSQMISVLQNAPKISATQIENVQTLLTTQPELPIPAPRTFTETIIEQSDPIPCLHLFQTSLYIPNGKFIMPTDTCVAELTFDYAGHHIPWFENKKTIGRLKNNQPIQIIRATEQEAQAIQLLQQLGLMLVRAKPHLSEHNQAKDLNYFLLDQEDSDPFYFNGAVLPVLREAGWKIEMAEDYPANTMLEPLEWYSEIDDTSSYDWFGLELGIILQDEKINLLPILQKLLPKLARDIKILDNPRPFRVQLPDNRYIQLPAERIQQILKILLELYDQDSLSEDDQLRLSRLHAARLHELEKAFGALQLRWFGGEKLRQLGEKLAKFKGIKKIKVPKAFQGSLRPYQAEGLNWLQFLREYELSGILADDMGLGKTVQALAHISLEKSSGRMNAPVLVIAPTSLMFNWQMEAKRFAPHLKTLVLHGIERKKQFDVLAEQDLILTTYPLIVRDKDILLQHHFHLLILDEAQYIKNAKNLATQVALQLKANHRLCLTGTPLENHLGELWSLFHFLMPGLLGAEPLFARLFRTPIEKHQDKDRQAHLQKRIAPFLLRRTKNQVAQELPEKIEMIRHVELADSQRDLYETIRVTMQKKVRDEIAQMGLARSHIIILDALLKLRQVCCDPRLLKIESHKKITESAKLSFTIELMTTLLEEGRRILLFSQFTGMLSLIEQELTAKHIDYVKLTGQTKDRATPVQRFQAGEVPLFLISLKAGGTGLNLTAADTVIHYDPWWNPAVENQATDRAHRIGQNKTVFVYKIVAQGTVEEKILEMQQNKRALMEGLFNEQAKTQFKLTEKDFQGLFEPLG